MPNHSMNAETPFHTALSLSLRNCFFLPNQWAVHCEHYFIRYWKLDYVLGRIENNMINYADQNYTVVFCSGDTTPNAEGLVRVSFRKSSRASGIDEAYVLVKGF